jgi:GNAT superfamily N-acetyltransferase
MPAIVTQAEIDRRTYTIRPVVFIGPRPCDYCGSMASDRRALSTEVRRGKMYICYLRQPGFDWGASLVLCGQCRATWMMWRARFGFDLHTHPKIAPCGPQCLAKRGGRRAQLQAQRSLATDRTQLFYFGKAIDGLPNVNASPPIMGHRVAMFALPILQRQLYYESIGKADELVRQIFLRAQLGQIGVPRYQLDGFLIVVEIFVSAHTAPRGALTIPSAGERSLGLHVVDYSGYQAGGNIIQFWNSWGSNWGRHGYGSMSRAYLDSYFREAWVMRNARYGPSLDKLSTPPPMPPKELRRRLMIENPRYILRQRKGIQETWRIVLYETVSPTTGDPVECVQIQTGFGLKMGWCFLRHRPSVTEILELYVWPTFRRMEVGTTLEELAVERTKAWGNPELRLILNEGDAVVGPPRSAARQFAVARGYRWAWRIDVAPRRTGTASKRV